MNKGDRIYVAGHRGLVGSAIVRALQRQQFASVLTATRHALDLRNTAAVLHWFKEHQPQVVFMAAAKVGGIDANDRYPADFVLENLEIQNSLFRAALEHPPEKLIFLGSSCIYPKFAEQPIQEEALLTGPLEATNQWYAVAKIAGIKTAQALRQQYGIRAISLMPTNLYGPRDNFDLQSSHVLPALLRKFHEAKQEGRTEVEIWGTGTPRREFLHADDLADACLFLAEHYDGAEIVNVGVGRDISIRELAELIADIVGFRGSLRFETGKPDGTPRKLLDVRRLESLGWRASIPLREGIEQTYRWFVNSTSR